MLKNKFYALLIIVLLTDFTEVTAQTNNKKIPVSKLHLKHINALTSPKMHGRGYVNKGDSVASRYIADVFKDLHLSVFEEGIFQEYNLKVNTFPGEMMLVVNDDTLKAGKDYMVIPQSGGGKREGEVVTITASDIQDSEKFKKKYQKIQDTEAIVYLNTRDFKDKDSIQFMKGLAYELSQNHPVIQVVSSKLMWAVGRDQTNHPVFEIIDSLAPEKIEKVSFHVEQELVEDYATQNVIAYVRGRNAKLRDEYIVFTAHYDHLGRMGKDAYFPGANDNASGTAMMLSLAHHFSKKPAKRSIVFIAFSGEEAGLVGSNYFVDNPYFDVKKIRFLLNLDIFGSGDDGITVVNGEKNKKEFDILNEINEEINAVPTIKNRKESHNSDHYPFTEKDVPAWFIYTMGSARHYHDIADLPENIKLENFLQLKELLWRFVYELE